MSMIWAGAVEIALAWAVILGVKIASNAFTFLFFISVSFLSY